MKSISVIIPVYNTAAYLRACLDSVLAQREHVCQLILVDDGSSDESGSICDEYAARHPELITVRHQRNQGVSAARNLGIDLARGEYLSFIDSDDYLEPDMYATLLELARVHQADMACGAMLVEKPGGEAYCRVPEGVTLCLSTREALIELNSYRYMYTSFACALVSRTAMGELRFPCGTLCEDYYLLHQVVARCKKVACTSHPVYHYVQRGSSRSRSTSVSLAPMAASKAQLAFFAGHFPDLAYVAQADCAFAHMSVYSAYARSGQCCPPALQKELVRTARRYLPSILRGGHLPFMKKMQALAFCLCLPLYRAVLSRTEHR